VNSLGMSHCLSIVLNCLVLPAFLFFCLYSLIYLAFLFSVLLSIPLLHISRPPHSQPSPSPFSPFRFASHFPSLLPILLDSLPSPSSRVQAVILALRSDRARYMHLTFIRYTHTHTHAQADEHVYSQACKHMHARSHTCTHTCTYMSTHVYLHIHIRIQASPHTLPRTHTHVHTLIYTRTHTRTYTLQHREGDGYAEAFFSRYLMEDR
jgi:hypothetical protein